MFGGNRFRSMDLFNVEGMPLLLDVCAKTLETLRLYPDDPRGEDFSPKYVRSLAENLAAGSSLHRFDLSRNQSLRALQATASASSDSPDAASSMFSRPSHPLCASTSWSFIEIVTPTIYYRCGAGTGLICAN